MELYTIGYEGLTIDKFITYLLAYDIDQLIDIRELPLSRKTGFSKNTLISELQKFNITYVHDRSLGCPKEIRHSYQADNDWENYSEKFLNYLDTQEVSLHLLSEQIIEKKSCLLCFEKDFYHCHRSYVAQYVIQHYLHNYTIKDLRVAVKNCSDMTKKVDRLDQLSTIVLGTDVLCLKAEADSFY